MEKQMLQKTIGDNLRKYRLLAHLTQEQVAEMANISSSFYANIENGNRSMSVEVLRELSEALQVSSDCILYEECESNNVKNVCALLKDKPKSFIMAVEGVIRSLIENFWENRS